MNGKRMLFGTNLLVISLLATMAVVCLAAPPVHAAFDIKTGTYTGDGTASHSVTGIGFQPMLVIVKVATTNATYAQTAQYRLDTMAGLHSNAFNQPSGKTDCIISLGADGFTVGSNTAVNRNGIEYYYVAMMDPDKQYLFTGSYTGDGTNDRNITGVGFQPDVVVVQNENGQFAVWKSSAGMPDEVTASFLNEADDTYNRIQSLLGDGFQIGSNGMVNENGAVFQFFCLRVLAGKIGVGSYTGNGSDDRSIGSVGFQPVFMWLKSDTTCGEAVARQQEMSSDLTWSFGERTATRIDFPDGIQAFEVNGFQVGADSTVNRNDIEYRWVAFGPECVNYYRDDDNDGYGQSDDSQCLTSPSDPYDALRGADCDDTDDEIHPGVSEVCNKVDDDCDGYVDEGLAKNRLYQDWDWDDYGDLNTYVDTCLTSMSGWVSDDSSDCDDTDDEVHPGATEFCNGVDDDCDGYTDEEGAIDCTVYYLDKDGDGYGDDISICACKPVDDYDVTTEGDCDDDDGDIYPGAPERCNGEDDDCDGNVPVDEGDPDSDGLLSCEDNCPDDWNPDQKDTDGDGVADGCDNCWQWDNPDQNDYDGDGYGNACDNCWYVYNGSQQDEDGDCSSIEKPYLSDPECGDHCECQIGDVDCDGLVSMDDCLCIFWRALIGVTPCRCRVDGADARSDVNCDGEITVGDAGMEFVYLLFGWELKPCVLDDTFVVPTKELAEWLSSEARPEAVAMGNVHSQSGRIVEVPVTVTNPYGMKIFGLHVSYPTDLVTFEGVKRTDLTEKWAVLDGQEVTSGLIALGGFNVDPIEAESPGSVAILSFRVRDGVERGEGELAVVRMLEDLQGAQGKTGSIVIGPELPTSYALEQNYPNPFNPVTTLSYTLPVQSTKSKVEGEGTLNFIPSTFYVTLKVFNVIGQEVAVLVDEVKEPGYYSVTWDASGMASGVYFYRLTAGEFTATRSMILMR